MPATTEIRCICGCGSASTLHYGDDFFARSTCRQRFYRMTVRAARNGDTSAMREITARGWNINANIGGGRASNSGTRRVRSASSASVERFGVEIEFNGCSAQAVIGAAAGIGGIDVQLESYNHSVRRYWKIVHDGSCGLELVSPPMSGEEGFEQIRKACQALRIAGARVDVRCGLHVHVDASRFDCDTIKRVISSYTANQAAINSILARSRHSSTFANRWTSVELASVERCTTVQDIAARVGTRYKTVNVAAFARFGTIEFRQHQGTHNAEKIIRWIKFVSAIVNESRARAVTLHSLPELMSALRLNNEDQAFFTERAMELA